MQIKKHIPNALTLGNLLAGSMAVISAINGDYETTGLLVMLGIFFDFLDGFVARILGVSGELGKQLDSLADMVTSGVVPGVVMFSLLQENALNTFNGAFEPVKAAAFSTGYLPHIGLLLTLAACYRLAKFNIDTRQSDSFIGMPTPAMSLFVISLPLIVDHSTNEFFINLIEHNYFLIGVTLVLSFLMNAEIPLFSLKFKDYQLKKNLLKYFFLVASLLLIVFLEFVAIPLIILLYVLLSLGSNLAKKSA
ncbi:phosphatidylserine synthase [Polaribacter pacificus]|uniref:Phosphatidylserine synthase n=1 Tax=Polaribacter pacificus TaxID=1775173 RepID=A0A917MG83_9FLAO|nr:CDP-alcohol phosphatidyltransferase family protein [Polaribacter pacificus]GGG99427.1 phosphatidylserine synthase [Polaribacter pacificus]